MLTIWYRLYRRAEPIRIARGCHKARFANSVRARKPEQPSDYWNIFAPARESVSDADAAAAPLVSVLGKATPLIPTVLVLVFLLSFREKSAHGLPAPDSASPDRSRSFGPTRRDPLWRPPRDAGGRTEQAL
jgi:hypothetical protein